MGLHVTDCPDAPTGVGVHHLRTVDVVERSEPCHRPFNLHRGGDQGAPASDAHILRPHASHVSSMRQQS